MEQKPLTIEELKEMAGQPVWCPDEEAYGIVMCDKIGQWAGIPFLHGVWYGDGNGCGVEFNHNIIKRRLRCYRTISEKDIPKPLIQKAAFGDIVMVCPNCENAAVINPYRKGRELYPHCPWCGQKLKEAEDETEKRKSAGRVRYLKR